MGCAPGADLCCRRMGGRARLKKKMIFKAFSFSSAITFAGGGRSVEGNAAPCHAPCDGARISGMPIGAFDARDLRRDLPPIAHSPLRQRMRRPARFRPSVRAGTMRTRERLRNHDGRPMTCQLVISNFGSAYVCGDAPPTCSTDDDCPINQYCDAASTTCKLVAGLGGGLGGRCAGNYGSAAGGVPCERGLECVTTGGSPPGPGFLGHCHEPCTSNADCCPTPHLTSPFVFSIDVSTCGKPAGATKSVCRACRFAGQEVTNEETCCDGATKTFDLSSGPTKCCVPTGASCSSNAECCGEPGRGDTCFASGQCHSCRAAEDACALDSECCSGKCLAPGSDGVRRCACKPGELKALPPGVASCSDTIFYVTRKSGCTSCWFGKDDVCIDGVFKCNIAYCVSEGLACPKGYPNCHQCASSSTDEVPGGPSYSQCGLCLDATCWVGGVREQCRAGAQCPRDRSVGVTKCLTASCTPDYGCWEPRRTTSLGRCPTDFTPRRPDGTCP